jgi:hypothetical protein
MGGEFADGASSNGPTTPTEVSETRKSRFSSPPKKREEGAAKNTHFQMVAEKSEWTHVRQTSKHDKRRWTHWLGMSVMLGLLLGGAYLLLLAMRPPSADALYLAATQQNDSGARKAFLNRFPKDPRFQEVESLLMADQLRATIRRLSLQAQVGVTPLTAAEDAFLQAMERLEEDPQAALPRIEQWLSAFDSAANRKDKKIELLFGLAEYERERLKAPGSDQRQDPRVADLMREIDAAMELSDAARRQEKLQDIIHLFGGKAWASSAVQRAEQLLDEDP